MTPQRNKQITVLSLFDGISCARVALDRLGYTDVLYLASEVDKYASAITRYQWPDTIHLGDITKIKRENLPVQIDLLIGGSPCQDLSIAKNNRKGLEGERSGLFWEWVRLWKECEPRYWVLENVNSMPKEAKRIISETLGVEPIMINAALVSAQNRKRLFWTNIQTDIFGNCHIPQPTDRGILLKHILESGEQIPEKSCPINATYWKSGTSPAAQEYSDRTHQRTLVVDNVYPGGGQNGNVYDTDGKSPTLSAGTGIKGRGIGSSNAPKVAEPVENGDKPIRVGEIESPNGLPHIQGNRIYSDKGKSVALSAQSGGLGSNTGLYAIEEARGVAIPEATKQGYAIAEEGDSVDLSYPNSKTRRGRVSKKAPSQMTSSQSVGVLEGYTIRKLTPIECERLMTLPDQYTALGDFGDGEAKPVSNTQRYKTLGNGFVVEVVAHILSFMEES